MQNTRKQTSWTRRSMVVVVAVALGALSSGCGAATVGSSAVGDVALFVPATEGSIVEAEISGEGMESPIIAPLDNGGFAASGIIDGVEEGSSRMILLTAYAPTGDTCSQIVSVEVTAGGVAKVDSPSLECIDPARVALTDEELAADLAPVASIRQ